MLYLPSEAKKSKLIPNDKLKYWQSYPDLNTFLKIRCNQDQKLSQSILCELPREYTQKYYLERQLDTALPTTSLNASASEDQQQSANPMIPVAALADMEESKEEQNAADAESAAVSNPSSPRGVIARLKDLFSNKDKVQKPNPAAEET